MERFSSFSPRVNRQVHLVSLFSQKRRSLSYLISVVLNRKNAFTSSFSHRVVVLVVSSSSSFSPFLSFSRLTAVNVVSHSSLYVTRSASNSVSIFLGEKTKETKEKRKLHFPSISSSSSFGFLSKRNISS